MKVTQVKRPLVKKIKPKLKVAAYARVSDDALHHSLSAQVNYYSSFIQSNPEWVYAGVYYDYAISGRSIEKRNDLKRMLKDCQCGSIDMVLVKSISRLARDTVDCLNIVRNLKNIGVAVYFERENINSLSSDGELMLTLLASFAQEESRSISENVKWAIRKKFKEGIPNGHSEPFGYFWNGVKYQIREDQGKVVKEIFDRYLYGESAYSIAAELAARGVKGNERRPIEQTTVKDILSNYSYTGTQILQKNYIDCNGKRKRNKGELPRYLVDDVYEPLVSEEDYQVVQKIRKERADEMPNSKVELTQFSGKIKCGYCGRGVSRRTSKKNKKWKCNTNERQGSKVCDCRAIHEEELVKATEQCLGNIPFSEVNAIRLFSSRVEFELENGSKKIYNRTFDGSRKNNALTGKIWCGKCGNKAESDVWVGKKIWICSLKRSDKSKCDMKRVYETEIYSAAENVLGDNFKGKIVEDIEKIVFYDDRFEFCFKDGRVKIWQRELE